MRQERAMSERTIFIERDGALLRTGNDTDNRAALRLVPDCITALQRFRAAGFAVVVLADSSGATAEPDHAPTDAFVTELLDSQGIRVESLRRCTHGSGPDCDCSAPGIGLVADFIADQDLDRRRSLVVGAREETLALARNMGVRGERLASGNGWLDIAHNSLDLPRKASVTRQTRETDITIDVDLDRALDPQVHTGLGFFDHMLEQLGKHGGFSLRIDCRGDLEVDEHHTIEDVALALGQALREALGDKRGIGRYGFLLPMDEAEAKVALDLSGRAYCVFEGDFPRAEVGGLPTELVGHFFRSLSDTLACALHIEVHGDNTHHMIEACFKGVARTLRQAFKRTGSDLPSTKGAL
jgi:imidazoleglycerol-phosphate dehydratase/histidinol-phosphatase